MSRTLWLFLTLTLGDIAIAILGKGRSSVTAKSSPSLPEALGPDDDVKEIQLITIADYQAVFLSERFGTGVFFWLQKKLTAHL